MTFTLSQKNVSGYESRPEITISMCDKRRRAGKNRLREALCRQQSAMQPGKPTARGPDIEAVWRGGKRRRTNDWLPEMVLCYPKMVLCRYGTMPPRNGAGATQKSGSGILFNPISAKSCAKENDSYGFAGAAPFLFPDIWLLAGGKSGYDASTTAFSQILHSWILTSGILAFQIKKIDTKLRENAGRWK